MVKGPRNHLKRLNAPSHWMLSKMGGIFAPRVRCGPHEARESIPLALIIRNRLQYANNYRECKNVLQQRFIKVDGKVRTDLKYPAGFMDVIEIEKTNDKFRLLYDSKGRFTLHKISKEECEYKLCRVKSKTIIKQGVPVIDLHDGRRVRFVDPTIRIQDTVKIHIVTGKVTKVLKFEKGNLCCVTGGANRGRIGEITNIEQHPGSFELVQIKDSRGDSFTTRSSNVFIIGEKHIASISLPKDKGIKLTEVEDRLQKIKNQKRRKREKISSKAVVKVQPAKKGNITNVTAEITEQ